MHFFRAGTIYVLANVAAAAVPFLLLPLLTRVLGPAEYSVVVAFGLWSTLMLPLAGMGVHGAVGVAWFRRGDSATDAFVGSALALACICTASVAVIATAVTWRWPDLRMGLTPLWAILAVISAGASVLLQCRLVLWQSQREPMRSALLQIFTSAVNVSLSLLATLFLGWGGMGRNAGIAAGACLMAALSVFLLWRAGDARWAPQREHIVSLLKFGAPLVPHALAGALLATADRWLVSAKLGAESLGIYGTVAQLGMAISILADAFVKAYSPWMYERLQAGTSEDRHCVVGAIYASVPAFATLAACVGTLLVWVSAVLLGPQYRSAVPLLPWFVLGGAMSGVYFGISCLYFFYQRTGLLALASVSAALLSLPCISFLVSHWGVQGAAIGFALAQTLLTIFATIIAFAQFQLPWALPHAALYAWWRRSARRV